MFLTVQFVMNVVKLKFNYNNFNIYVIIYKLNIIIYKDKNQIL
jgi:hypothetical protein